MEKKMVPISVYAEMTPNPAVLKFVCNKRLLEADSVEFRNIEEAKPSPLATRLFHFPFVKEVFVTANYIAITKYDIIEWEDVTLEVRHLITDFLREGGEILSASTDDTTEKTEQTIASVQARHPEEKDPDDFTPIETKIVSLLDEYVKPAVESDGGNIKFLTYDEGSVKVLLQGACSGCPSSTMTLKQGIQNLLQEMLPGQIREVVAVNG